MTSLYQWLIDEGHEGKLPKDLEHSKDCLYVIEPRYFGNTAKELDF